MIFKKLSKLLTVFFSINNLQHEENNWKFSLVQRDSFEVWNNDGKNSKSENKLSFFDIMCKFEQAKKVECFFTCRFIDKVFNLLHSFCILIISRAKPTSLKKESFIWRKSIKLKKNPTNLKIRGFSVKHLTWLLSFFTNALFWFLHNSQDYKISNKFSRLFTFSIPNLLCILNHLEWVFVT